VAKRRSFEGSAKSAAPVAAVWQVWTNPSQWAGGVSESASVAGDFVVGSKLRTEVKGFPPSTSTIARVDPPGLWINRARLPGLTLSYMHIIGPAGDGAVLIERAVLSGPLAGIAALVLGRRRESTFAETTAHCARVAESLGAPGR
jgi:hypothetical protein